MYIKGADKLHIMNLNLKPVSWNRALVEIKNGKEKIQFLKLTPFNYDHALAQV